MKSTKLVALTTALSLFAACRSGGDDDGGDDETTDDGGSADDTSIVDIQSDDMPVGEPVTVRGAVVVAVDAYGGRADGLYIMEPEGGAYSGVFVFGADVADLAPGDLVDVEGGVKDEFALPEDDTGRTLTEISPAEGGAITATKVGDGEVPEAETVEPWELVADDFADAEQWEGVLVRFENVRVNSPPEGVTTSDETLQEMRVTGPYIVQSALTAFDGIEAGTCYSSIVGIGDYFFNYKLLPRSADDLVPGDDGDCIAPEATDEVCGDGMDNDYNGYSDCDDFACAAATVACPVTQSSVAAIQAGEIPVDSEVSLVGVTVTGVAFNRKQFWVQDSGVSAENNGVFVFQFGDAEEIPAEVVVGATLDLAATVVEFDCSGACAEATLTELTSPVISNVVAPVEEPAPLAGLSYDAVVSDVDGEPYEGVLIRLENVAVVQPSAGTNEFSIGDATAELVVDDVIFRYLDENTVEEGQCLSAVTGIMHRDTFDDFGGQATILPRSAADVDATPGTCQ